MKRDNHLKVIAIVFARMASVRLPGKALMLAGQQPLIAHCLEKAACISGVDQLVLATSERCEDDALVAFAQQAGYLSFRGSSDDVAMRALQCAQYFDADAFIRINGDSPYLDPKLIEQGLRFLSPDIELVSNLFERTYPYGVAVEIIQTHALQRVYSLFDAAQKEHITQYFYQHVEQFNTYSLTQSGENLKDIRLVVDTADDFAHFCKLLSIAPQAIAQGDYQLISDYYRQFAVQSVK